MSSSKQTKQLEASRVNAELVKLSYGALVAQLFRDYGQPAEVNKRLSTIGYNMGVRLVEDFIAHHSVDRCSDLREVSDKLSTAFKIYLASSPVIGNWSAAADEFSLIWQDANPLGDFVELGSEHEGLDYARLLCGCIRGALEMVQLDVDVSCLKDHLKGDNRTEFRVRYLRKLEDALPAGED